MKNNLQKQYEVSQRETDEKLFKRIPSSFFNNDFWISTDPFDRRAALIDLYSLAFDSYRNGSQVIHINDSVVRIFSGQVARGLRSLAIRWNWSTKKVSNFLRVLEDLGYIEIVKTRPVTIFEIKDFPHRNFPKKNNKETGAKHHKNAKVTKGE